MIKEYELDLSTVINFKLMRISLSVLIVLTSLFFAIKPAHSQQFTGGIVAGLAGTQVKGDGLAGPDKAGIVVGPYVNLELSRKSSLQMQLEYFQKGSRANPDSTNNFQSYLLRLNYVQIPVMYQYRYNEDFGFESGLSYGMLVYDYEEIYTNFTSKEPFEQGDLSFHAGMRWYVSDRITAEFEFSHSLMYIRRQTKGVTWFFNKGQYNHVLLLGIQYEIRGLF